VGSLESPQLRSAAPGDPVAPPGAPEATAGRRNVDLTKARHALASWRQRPPGRLVLAGALIAVLVTLSGLGGAYLVPTAAGPGAAAESAGPGDPAGNPAGEAPSAGPTVPDDATLPAATAGPPVGGRPADVLAGWAAPLASRLAIPPVAMEAYGYAELVLNQQKPTCQLHWTTLAAIGKIESNHGQAGGSLGADGRTQPPIIGPALNGQEGRKQVLDTDSGQLDRDAAYDHAVGPMQFLPGTWKSFAVDADRDGQADPFDVDDAALAAAEYLCSGARDLSTGGGWWAAVLAYNDVQRYAQDVFTAAMDYGRRSH
jgi:hypothetical protein